MVVFGEMPLPYPTLPYPSTLPYPNDLLPHLHFKNGLKFNIHHHTTNIYYIMLKQRLWYFWRGEGDVAEHLHVVRPIPKHIGMLC